MSLLMLLRFWREGVMGALLILLGVQTLRLEHAKGELRSARTDLATASASIAALKAARTADGLQAASSATAQAEACNAQLATARIAGRTIERIIHDPAPLPSGVDRRIVPAADLRLLIGEANAPDARHPGVPH